MRLRVLPEFGAARLSDLSRPDLQDFVERLISEDLAASTIQVTLLPLRAIFRRALSRGELLINPCTALEMPAITGRRERFATSIEAEALIAAAPEGDRALWATALYAGLRRGELMALCWDAVDLATGLIHVRHGWDMQEGQIDLKTRSGFRKVPIIPVLRDHLIDHRLLTGRDEGFVFGRDADRVFEPGGNSKRASKAWKAAKLQRITLHECRHTFASLMIAAGVNAKALSTLHEPREHFDHPRPLRAPDAGVRGRGRAAARCIFGRSGSGPTHRLGSRQWESHDLSRTLHSRLAHRATRDERMRGQFGRNDRNRQQVNGLFALRSCQVSEVTVGIQRLPAIAEIFQETDQSRAGYLRSFARSLGSVHAGRS